MTRKVLDLNPGEMLQGDRLRGADRGDAQPGQVPRGEPHRRAAAGRGAARTSPSRSPTTRWPTTWRRWRRTSTRPSTSPAARSSCRRTRSSSSRSPPSAGCTTSARSSTRRSTSSRESSELGPSPATLTHLGMALLASGEEDQARSVLAHARAARRARRGAAGKDDGVHEGLRPPARARPPRAAEVGPQSGRALRRPCFLRPSCPAKPHPRSLSHEWRGRALAIGVSVLAGRPRVAPTPALSHGCRGEPRSPSLLVRTAHPTGNSGSVEPSLSTCGEGPRVRLAKSPEAPETMSSELCRLLPYPASSSPPPPAFAHRGSTHTRPSRAVSKWAASGPQVPAG